MTSLEPTDPAPLPLARTVGEDAAGLRLDVFLVRQDEVSSRAHAKALVLQGKVRVDGEACKPGQNLAVGQEVAFDPDLDMAPRERPALEIPKQLEVVFEDDYVLVANKPVGLASHPPEGLRAAEPSLVDLALAHCPDLTRLPGVDRPGIVHRLDRETSGVMVLAKTDEAYQFLKSQFKSRQVQKEYRAIAYGEARFDSDWIERNIATHPTRGDRMTVVQEGGREASTYYEVLQRFRGFTYFRCQPKSGRTHQIRVHLMSVGHALVGDRLYRSRKTQARGLPEEAPDPRRHCLHAFGLGFAHPRSRAPLHFEVALPEDMARLLCWLEAEKSLDA